VLLLHNFQATIQNLPALFSQIIISIYARLSVSFFVLNVCIHFHPTLSVDILLDHLLQNVKSPLSHLLRHVILDGHFSVCSVVNNHGPCDHIVPPPTLVSILFLKETHNKEVFPLLKINCNERFSYQSINLYLNIISDRIITVLEYTKNILNIGMWLSLVEHWHGVPGVAGSSPVIPILFKANH